MTAQTEAPDAGRWSELAKGQYGIASAVLSGGMALHAVNLTISSTMLPSIVAEIGGQALYAWNATLATLAAILSAAVTGKLMRRLGARGGFALAGAVFVIGSLIAALAVSMPMMLVGRVVQGAGGGMMFTLCYAMIVFIYPERLWSRALALLSGVWGVTMLFGPAVGGIFAELDIWRAGFGVMVPLTGIFVGMCLLLLPRVSRDQAPAEPIALYQLALLAGSVLTVSVGSVAPSAGWAVLAVAAAVVQVLLLMRAEQGRGPRLFPRGALQPGNPLFLSVAVMALLIFCVNAEFFMPFYLQRLHGLGPLMAGYIAALVSIGWAGSEVWSARLTGRAMHRVVLAGPLVMLAACAALGLATPMSDSAGPQLTTVMALGLIGLGIGIGIGWPHLNTFVLRFADPEERDVAASALSTVQMFAVAIGTALAGMVGNATGFRDVANTAAVANSAFWLFALFGAVAAIAVWASRTLIRQQIEAPEQVMRPGAGN
jgi:MFS family permease